MGLSVIMDIFHCGMCATMVFDSPEAEILEWRMATWAQAQLCAQIMADSHMRHMRRRLHPEKVSGERRVDLACVLQWNRSMPWCFRESRPRYAVIKDRR